MIPETSQGRKRAYPVGVVWRIFAFFRERRAQRRLAQIVADTRNSYECRRYRERRAAALKGLGR